MSDDIHEITPVDMMTLLMAEIKQKGIVGHHIKSMNNFIEAGIHNIVTKVFVVENRIRNERDATDEDRDIADVQFTVNFTNVTIDRPKERLDRSGQEEPVMPARTIENKTTYKSEIRLDAEITAVALMKNGTKVTRADRIVGHSIGYIPTMIGTERCNTRNLTREAKKLLHEDPDDIGGYFIINGSQWAVLNLENITNNMFHVFKNAWKNERARGQIISKPGDQFENSYMTLIRYLEDGSINVDLSIGGKKKLTIPFNIMFRVLGMTEDRQIADNIIYGADNEDAVSKHIKDILEIAFAAENPQFKAIKDKIAVEDILEHLAAMAVEVENATLVRKDESARKYVAGTFQNMVDRYFLPHVGVTPEARLHKARFLGHLINKLLRVYMGVADSTDRDSYRNKRVAPAGISEAKAFKTDFNIAIVQQVKKRLTRAFKSSPFSSVDLKSTVVSALNTDMLEKLLGQAIIAGNRTIQIKQSEVHNRISSTVLYYKNDLNVISTMNVVDTPGTASKSTDRADEMRRVHPTFIGFIDVSQSADTGEKVGMNKQLACTASVCEASSSFVLRNLLQQDSEIIPLDDVSAEQITREALAKVLVNGYWLGCCRDAYALARKYRTMRRAPDSAINPYTTIVCEYNTRELSFWTDYGRLTRPLVIVYSNYEEYKVAQRAGKPIPFSQWIKLTPQHIAGLRAGKLTMDDLRAEGVIEYISPEEQENAYLALNIDIFRADATNLQRQYTHVDIEQAIFGLVSLAAPMANHSSATRVTYWTNHRKQSNNWPAKNFPYHVAKNLAVQHYCEKPIVHAFTDSLTNPNGQNITVAYAMYTGDNGEDSILVNETSVAAGMFNTSTYNFERVDFERGSQPGSPDPARTKNYKNNANHEHIEGGFVRVGTLLKKGTVLVVKTMKLAKPEGEFLYIDKSLVYKKEETARVVKVIHAKNVDGEDSVSIVWRTFRPVGVGDKMSSRSGNKGIVSRVMPRCDMPFTETGLIPDAVVNGHSFPTRMAVNQIIECVLGIHAAKAGVLRDATSFRKLDIDGVIAELDAWGIKNGGHVRMFNGFTGEWIDSVIFIGPTTYQRLSKFVIDEYYAIERGSQQPMTRQPLDGKANDGGLRMGEMEKDVYAAHGVMRALDEKFRKDSDGTNIYICRSCGNRAVVGVDHGIANCRHCPDPDIYSVPSTWCANLFFNTVNAMGVKTTFELE